jgi:hypothetical protein
MVAPERVQDEGLVRLGDLGVHKPPLVRQVHLDRHRARVQTGHLAVKLEVRGFRRLDADDELVAGDVLEDALRDVLELDTDLDFGFVQSLWNMSMKAAKTVQERNVTFACLEDEGDTLPSWVVDPEGGSSECRAG